MNTLHVTSEGGLNAEIARREIARQARLLILEGLASEPEHARLLLALGRDGYGQVRARLLDRQALLAAVEPIISDFFAFQAVTRN